MKRIVIASDSYKGSRTSLEIAGYIEKGARRVFPDAEYVKIPIADGGEGTVEALTAGLGGRKVPVKTKDPLGRSLDAFYGVVGDKAVLEMAAASGYALLGENEKNPMVTSTYGTGLVLLAALEAGFRNITIGIGGSATNDGGAGLARALGYEFFDAQGQPIQDGGGALVNLDKIVDSSRTPLLDKAEIHVACDVDNPLLGRNGASYVYGPQKGAGPKMVTDLEKALAQFADVTEQWKGCSMRDVPGAGAAGGLGFGLTAFCGAKMQSGVDTILDLVDFESRIDGASLVVTGEGRIDGQSLRGKVPIGVATRAKPAKVPVLAIVGSIGKGSSAVYEQGIDSIMCSMDKPATLEEIVARTEECVVDSSERAFRMIRMGQRSAGR